MSVSSIKCLLAESLLRQTISKIDAAQSKGVIHKNAASRKVGRLAAALYKAKNTTVVATEEKVEEKVEAEVIETPVEKKTTAKKTTKKAEATEEKPAKKTTTRKTTKKAE